MESEWFSPTEININASSVKSEVNTKEGFLCNRLSSWYNLTSTHRKRYLVYWIVTNETSLFDNDEIM